MTDALSEFRPDRVLLAAVDRTADDAGWTTADAIRKAIDGLTARGRWARRLWEHAEHGYLEQRFMRGTVHWALTAKAVEVVRGD